MKKKTTKAVNTKERDKFLSEILTFPSWQEKNHPMENFLKGEYDIYHFEDMDVHVAKQCVIRGWLDLNEKQNDSPTVGEIIKFMESNPSFSAHGYIVSGNREDTRISFEGVKATMTPEKHEIVNYIDMFRTADEFDAEFPFRAWFD